MSRPRPPLRIAVPAACIAAVALFAVFYLKPMEVSDADRAALVLSKDIGLPAPDGNETFSKSRTMSAATELHYRAFALGTHGRGTLDEITFDYFAQPSAVLGFKSIALGGKGGFALAAGKNQSMQPRDIHFAWADDSYWADYRVDGNVVGAFVLARVGNAVHFISLNGIVTDAQRLEPVLREHWTKSP